MNDAAIRLLRSSLANADREFRSAADTARRTMEEAERHPTAWANVASHAVLAAHAAGQVEACHDALVAAGEL
ncbi:hypothetical protein [Dactylosporangium sp. CA-139066]|uniref:hypothetical protein n=1 Tax=Dactylosporangium sp. CA-139066 TaxID=3239930 RepID=UPI003D8A89CF